MKYIGRINPKPFIDLVIVITGVSVAFLLNNFNERKKEAAEKLKVLTSLERELVEITELFPSMADYQKGKIKTWDSLLVLHAIDDFYNYRYVQPQYNFSIIEYAMETRNSNVVDFELHEKLLKLYKAIRMLEQSEIHMTELALQYQAPISQGLNQTTPQNLFLFDRFRVFAKSREQCLRNVHELAAEILPMLQVRAQA